jgi:TM2 domain-containing membrane protein YozV
MSEAWKRIDLEGGGLQAANRRLAATLRSRRTAYLLWLAFAVGAHRFYLRSPLGGIAWCVASGATLLLAGALPWAGVGAALAGLAGAIGELWWIDRRVTQLNKALRMRAYLGAGPGAPPGYRGRFVDDAQDASAAPPRAPGFAEQERLLAEIERRKRDTH